MRFSRYLILSATLLPIFAVQAERVVLPVAIYAPGANNALWATEIRATNHTGGDLMLHVMDFVGVLGSNLSFAPGDYVVPAGQVRSFGAYNLLSPTLDQCDLACRVAIGFYTYFGVFVLDLDAGVSLEAAILAGVAPPPTGFPVYGPCSVWE